MSLIPGFSINRSFKKVFLKIHKTFKSEKKTRLFNVNVYIGVSRFVRRCAALNGVLYEILYHLAKW